MCSGTNDTTTPAGKPAAATARRNLLKVALLLAVTLLVASLLGVVTVPWKH
jgi:hypothetical protein